MFYAKFLLPILSQLCTNLKDFIKIVRLFLAALSINGLKKTRSITLDFPHPHWLTRRVIPILLWKRRNWVELRSYSLRTHSSPNILHIYYTFLPHVMEKVDSVLSVRGNPFKHAYSNIVLAGLKIRGCLEPRASLNSPVAPSNFWREPKNVLVSIHNTVR